MFSGQARGCYQTVLICPNPRIVRSLVTRTIPSARAVAPISRSLGSFEYVAGSWLARIAILGVIGRMAVREETLSIKSSIGPVNLRRPLLASHASSQRVIAEMASPPLSPALWIKSAAVFDNLPGSLAAQINAWVSKRIISSKVSSDWVGPRAIQCHRRFRIRRP